MVYFYTSQNVKLIRDIINDYKKSSELTSQEYIDCYAEKRGQSLEKIKLIWLKNTFLSIMRHEVFLTKIANCISKHLELDEQLYFVILFHGILFQIKPAQLSLLYKCLYNLSKNLLYVCCNYLSHSKGLPSIAQNAETLYDTNFITNEIITPLVVWQPFLKEMANTYDDHKVKLEQLRKKSATIPLSVNVLNRSTKKKSIPLEIEETVRSEKKKSKLPIRMLSKSAIEKRLKSAHEKNKRKAIKLLQKVQENIPHHAQERPKVSVEPCITNNTVTKPVLNSKPYINKECAIPVKQNVSLVKRLNKLAHKEEQEQLDWLDKVVNGLVSNVEIDLFMEQERERCEMNRLSEIEKKHVLGQLSHEEAVLSKLKLKDRNKRRFQEILNLKRVWNDEIEQWKKQEMAKNLKCIEKCTFVEFCAMEAKQNNISQKRDTATEVKQELEKLRQQALQEKNEDLERRVQVIKDIKMLAMLVKQTRLPKIIDLTATSGIGALNEMSIMELQERLAALKMTIKQDIENKRKEIIAAKNKEKQDLENKKMFLNKYFADKEVFRQSKKSLLINMKTHIAKNFETAEIKELKKNLEEKRQLRLKYHQQ